MQDSLKNKCCVVIPVYKKVERLRYFEKESLKQVINILGSNYDLYLMTPNSLDTDSYNDYFNYKFLTKKFPDNNFESTYTYSQLLTTTTFYNKFNKYEYMFIYQLDGWIFYDNINYFIELNYDWYGSPWVIDGIEGVGNGGVCLRKIESCKEICKKYGKTSNCEDQYFCIKHKDKLNIAPIDIALEFGLCSNSHNKYFTEDFKCPMICHQPFNSNHYEYWQKYILYSNGKGLENKKCIKFNKDSLDMKNYSNLFKGILSK